MHGALRSPGIRDSQGLDPQRRTPARAIGPPEQWQMMPTILRFSPKQDPGGTFLLKISGIRGVRPIFRPKRPGKTRKKHQ